MGHAGAVNFFDVGLIHAAIDHATVMVRAQREREQVPHSPATRGHVVNLGGNKGADMDLARDAAHDGYFSHPVLFFNGGRFFAQDDTTA